MLGEHQESWGEGVGCHSNWPLKSWGIQPLSLTPCKGEGLKVPSPKASGLINHHGASTKALNKGGPWSFLFGEYIKVLAGWRTQRGQRTSVTPATLYLVLHGFSTWVNCTLCNKLRSEHRCFPEFCGSFRQCIKLERGGWEPSNLWLVISETCGHHLTCRSALWEGTFNLWGLCSQG